VIDGAHAPGQIPVSLDALDADFYTGNCHKWLLSPKGAGFLYVHPRAQGLVEPLVVGWGWNRGAGGVSNESEFIENQQWLGTNDLSAYLAVPAAIDFQQEHGWPGVQAECHDLLQSALKAVDRLTGFDSIYADPAFYAQMAVAALPPLGDPSSLRTSPQAFKRSLYESHRVEIPVTTWRDRHFLRISIQGYNTRQDVDRLIDALAGHL
jgi:isopenicillin-N epimerase